MNLKKIIATKSGCYAANRTITPKGIMVHSTGANNPNLWRYVAPDDGTIGVNKYNNSFNTPDGGGRDVCPHAVIGKLKDGSVATVQILPWNRRGWHAGGKANDTHISFEIAEDGLTDKAYFDKIYQEAVELCAMLCKEYNINPLINVIDHAEGYKLGIASAHADVGHWFGKFGKTMTMFRTAVKAEMGKQAEPKKLYRVQVGAFSSKANAENFLKEIKKKGLEGYIV